MISCSVCSPSRSSISSWRISQTMFARGLKPLSFASVVLIVGAFALVFFYAPNDADQAFIQKIFYLHVPLAIVALCGFVAGGVWGIQYLRTGHRAHDLRSYVSIHLSLILAGAAFSIGGGAFVPLNFLAVRLAQSFTHPRVLSATGGSMPGEMRLTFMVSVLAATLLFVTLWKLELTAKSASMRLKRLRR